MPSLVRLFVFHTEAWKGPSFKVTLMLISVEGVGGEGGKFLHGSGPTRWQTFAMMVLIGSKTENKY